MLLSDKKESPIRGITGLGGGIASYIFYGSGPGGEYEISRSLRFNSADTAYLNRTPSSAGNRRTWTMSFWIKLTGGGTSGINPVLEGGFSGSGGSQGGFGIKFTADQKLQIVEQNSNSITWQLVTSSVYRDYSSWYSVVIALDTTQSTAADRVKIWVNGEQVTGFSTSSYPSQNYESNLNKALPHRIGASDGGGSPYLPMSAYLADVHFIDGQALAPTDFGEFDSNGVWQPKEFTGTYATSNTNDEVYAWKATVTNGGGGTGWYFTQENNSTSLGLSGNTGGHPDELGGNTLGARTGESNIGAYGTFATANSVSSGQGVINENASFTQGTSTRSFVYNATVNKVWVHNGSFWVGGGNPSNTSSTPTFYTPSSGNVRFGVILVTGETYTLAAIDSSVFSGTATGITYSGGSANVTLGSGNTTAITSTGSYSDAWSINFGNNATGLNSFYLNFSDNSSNTALGTDSSGGGNNWSVNNLIASVSSVENPYKGMTSRSSLVAPFTVNDLGFRPDLVIAKSTSNAEYWIWTDSVRGFDRALESNNNSSETTNGSGVITNVNSTGFQSTTERFTTSRTYATWCWKAGGAAVLNENGSIDSQVSANNTYGFSIVSYNSGSSNGEYTLGHGLTSTPKFIIHKTRASGNWWVYHESVVDTTSKYLQLNSTNGVDDNQTSMWGASLPTSSVFGVSVGQLITQNTDAIAYVWSEVEGYSKFGTYTSNSNSSQSISTGFRPEFVLIKGVGSNGFYWVLFDASRGGTSHLLINDDNEENIPSGIGDITFDEDGFTIPSSNDNGNIRGGGDYVYAAFAKAPNGEIIDSLVDTPTNYTASGNNGGNYCTWNPLTGLTGSWSDGNLDIHGNPAGNKTYTATMGAKSGKWYWEVKPISGTNVEVPGMIGIVLSDRSVNGINLNGAGAMSYYQNGNKQGGNTSGVDVAYGDSFTFGDIIGVALDLDSSPTTLTFYKNGVSQGVAFNPDKDLGYWMPAVSAGSGSNRARHIANFGQRPFAYTPPTGFKSLCTTNLPNPLIEDGSTAMDMALWIGDGSNQTITGLNFSPDFVWAKSRSTDTTPHLLVDTVRGASQVLYSHSSDTEQDYSGIGGVISAFNSDGFDTGSNSDIATNNRTFVGWAWDAGTNSNKTYTVKVVSDSGNKYRFDDYGTSAVTLDLEEGSTYIFDASDSSVDGHPFVLGTSANSNEYSTGVTYTLDGSVVTYAAYTSGFAAATTRTLTITVPASAPTLYYWCSVHSGMGGQINTNVDAGSSNFDGSLQSTVRANQSAGFSIVSYSGSGGASTVGHSLNANPELILLKEKDGSQNWRVHHVGVDDFSKTLFLNLTNPASNNSERISATSSSTFTLSSGGSGVNASGKTYIAYCWASVEGYSAFGKYTGNGSTDGPFVYTGHRSRFILIKRTDSAADWVIYDTARGTYNPNPNRLYPNLTDAETSASTSNLLVLSNGFRPITNNGTFNTSGGTYLFASFAEHPFKTARAR